MALASFWYSSVIFPIKMHIELPGNKGDGIKSDAARNIKKKTIRIDVPFIFHVFNLAY